MHPAKVTRENLNQLTDLPNVGPSIADDLRLIGIDRAEQLKGKDPFKLYRKLCKVTGQRHDPCVIDAFMSITSFMDGHPPRPWWEFTEERKRLVEKAERAGQSL